MARKTSAPVAKKAPVPAKSAAKAGKPVATSPVRNSPVRNSPIPKVAAKSAPVAGPAPKVITHEMIAIRAFEISCGPNCGSEFDNWCRAERELRGM